MIATVIKSNRAALVFLGKFLALYVVLNVAYGLYIEASRPAPDLITLAVAKNTAWLLSAFHDGIQTALSTQSSNVPMLWNGVTVVEIFEGCNAVNVWIVFVSFLIAFSSKWGAFWKFIVLGTVVIYAANLLRVSLLFWIAWYFPESLYLFHKYFFTAGIYGVVFFLWYLYVRRLKRSDG